MKPVLLFDIDRTLFDTENFITYFRNKFVKFLKVTPQSLDKVYTKYRKSLSKHTDYNPDEFIKHLINQFHQNSQSNIYKKLHNLFYEPENFSKNLFSDTLPSLKELKTRHRLGIFSEGHPPYQKAKLVKSSLYDLFDPKELFILRRKTTAKSLLDLPDQSTIADDDASVIQDLLDQKIKTLYPIWLNRNSKNKHPHAKTIHSLTELV